MSDKQNDGEQGAAASSLTNSSGGVSSAAPNYGTMDVIDGSKPLSIGEPSEPTSERSNNNSNNNNNNNSVIVDSEAPTPAIRRKILQKGNRTRMVVNDSNESGSGSSEIKADKIKQQVGLPQPENFQLVQQAKQYEQAKSHSESKSRCRRPYPKKVAFIVATEFCERFSYYGLRAVLMLYFKSVLDLNESSSAVSFHLFVTLCYLTPILGAILGDTVWGKYKTILYLSVVYFIGELLLVLASVFWESSDISAGTTFVGLLLIGIGTGGIKPCVGSFGGDQFHTHEILWREKFFSYFYAAINLGSLISMFLTPALRRNYQCVNRTDCYPYAFGVPCAFMFIAILIFVAANNHYAIVPLPERNVLLAFCQCVWLALKRKLSGARSATLMGTPLMDAHHRGEINRGLSSSADNTSGSSLASTPEEQLVVVLAGQKQAGQNIEGKQKAKLGEAGAEQLEQCSERDRNHWLYLASDQFDNESIENFRCVLGIFLLFLPMPIYWSLFDQQGSLWTLQATRMDGRIPNTNFILEPDQMMAANPLLLLAAVALFQMVLYPCMNKFNLLASSLKRMTAGGLVAAAAYVASALIEMHMQQRLPAQEPPSGLSNLLLVNGLSDCAIVNPTISYVQMPANLVVPALAAGANIYATSQPKLGLESIEPLRSIQVNLLSSASANSSSTAVANSYQFKFKLANEDHMATFVTPLLGNGNRSTTAVQSESQLQHMCPFDSSQSAELSVGALPEKSSKLVYIQQGNGKLTYKLFNDTMALPAGGKAMVRILFDYFGSSGQALTRQFSLVRQQSSQPGNKSQHNLESLFQFDTHDGQVLASDYIDVDVVSTLGDYFKLKLSDSISNNSASIYVKSRLYPLDKSDNSLILLKPGTRNLLIVQQIDSKTFKFQHELLQDNEYRVSILFQLVPYTLISVSEVLFSVTGFEFSYTMAPDSMKSLVTGAWLLTTAMGNIITVLVEAVQPFANLTHKFLFYAVLMTLDIIVFALIGYYYKPYKPKSTSLESKQ